MGTFIPRNNVKYMKIFLKHKSFLSLLVTNKYTTQSFPYKETVT